MNVWVLQFAYTAPSASGYLLLAWSLFTSGWWWTNKRHNYSLPSSCSSPHLSSIISHHGDYICTTITFAPIQSLCSLCVGFASLVRFPNCRVPKASGLGNPTRALLVRFPNCRVPEASGLGNLTILTSEFSWATANKTRSSLSLGWFKQGTLGQLERCCCVLHAFRVTKFFNFIKWNCSSLTGPKPYRNGCHGLHF